MLTDTIVAVATPNGRGGVGIVRLSGPKAMQVASKVVRVELSKSRITNYTDFFDSRGNKIDTGLVVFFKAPNSYTGENVIEMHMHGNPIILGEMVRACCELDARLARPGEFTERAFRAGKINLLQAEAVADLIAAQSVKAVRSAQNTLEGHFGNVVEKLILQTQEIRYQLEAAIDFSDDVDSPDFIPHMFGLHKKLLEGLNSLLASATQGAKLSEGFRLVIAGPPNAGKSMLLNRLVQSERAIVSSEAGTTRDAINVECRLRDIPVQIIDTAGLREDVESSIEKEGIKRTYAAIEKADLVIYLKDVTSTVPAGRDYQADLVTHAKILTVYNKLDKLPETNKLEKNSGIYISALSGAGVASLEDAIIENFDASNNENVEFSARERHLIALNKAINAIVAIEDVSFGASPELVAEDYREATGALQEIGGEYSTEDLLGDIFSKFCIGK